MPNPEDEIDPALHKALGLDQKNDADLPERIAEAEEEDRKRNYRIKWMESSVPTEFEKGQPDFLRPFLETPPVLKVRETIRKYAETRTQPQPGGKGGLVIGICGSSGIGKTTVAVELLRMGAQNWCSVRYFTLDRYLRSLANRNFPAGDIEEEFVAPKMVVIDDIYLAELPSDRRALEQLVVDRSAQLRFTILVATCDPKEFGNILGVRVVDRFHAQALTLIGKSHRHDG